MPTKPIITTIIPTYRRPLLLARAIKSVLNQTYPEFNVFICDDASGDETRKVVEHFMAQDSRVKYYCHEKNIGGIKNYPFAMQKITTDFFTFLSDDDALLPTFFERVIEEFVKYPDAAYVTTQVVTMNDKGRICGKPMDYFPAGYYPAPTGIVEMTKYGPPIWNGTCFRGDVMREFGLVSTDVGLVSDHEYLLRIAASKPFVVTDYPGAIFLAHADQISSMLVPAAVFKNRKTLVNKITDDYRIEGGKFREKAAGNVISNANRYLVVPMLLSVIKDGPKQVREIYESARGTSFLFIRRYAKLLLIATRIKILNNFLILMYRFYKTVQLKDNNEVQLADNKYQDYLLSLVPRNGMVGK